MKKIILVSTLTLAMFTGCSIKTSAPQQHNMNLHEVNMKEVSQMKKGTACQARFLMIFPVGTDDTVLTAASNGDISKVEYVEKSASGIPFLYNEVCTDVYGK